MLFSFFDPKLRTTDRAAQAMIFIMFFFFRETNLTRVELDDYYENKPCERTYVPFKNVDCKFFKYLQEDTRK